MKDEDLTFLMSTKKGRILVGIKWALVFFLALTESVCVIVYSTYTQMPVEQQITSTTLGLNTLTVLELGLSLLIAVIILLYIMVEKASLNVVILLRYKQLTKRVKNVLKSNPRHIKEDTYI